MTNKQNINLPPSKLKKINEETIKGSDKWFRMYCGISSNLEKYENGIIYLRIENTETKIPSDYKTSIKFAKHWIECNKKELGQAKGFVVLFYKILITGFVLKPSDLSDKNKLKNLVRQFNVLNRRRKKLVGIFSGLFNDKLSNKN